MYNETEQHGQSAPDDGPRNGFLKGNGMRFPVENSQVNGKHDRHKPKEGYPEIDFSCH